MNRCSSKSVGAIFGDDASSNKGSSFETEHSAFIQGAPKIAPKKMHPTAHTTT